MMKISDNILRPRYMDKLIPLIKKGMIKVLTGQRRVGKSHILKAMENHIRSNDGEANFITINLEDYAFAHITDAGSLHKEISSRLVPHKRNYIFIDEIQEVTDFDKAVRSLNLSCDNDIYITGSNSAMLSSEIASRLAGRSMEIHVHPLSYDEYLEFHAISDSDEAMMLFLRYGGMPYLRNLPDRSTWDEYLLNITDAIVYRDIVSRHNIRNNNFLQRLMSFLADNMGKIFTAKNIADFIKSQRISSSVTSVQTYADYVCQAYIVNCIRRWDIRGKRFFKFGEKYYFEDLGIRNAIVGYRPQDIGGILENAVCNKLMADGYNVAIGTLPGDREIDFIAERNSERKYIQVALNVDNPATANREFGNLTAIPDNYEKIVVTLRDSSPNTLDGIHLISLRQFLLQ